MEKMTVKSALKAHARPLCGRCSRITSTNSDFLAQSRRKTTNLCENRQKCMVTRILGRTRCNTNAALLHRAIAINQEELGGQDCTRSDVEKHTLKVLGWESVCTHVSLFASTHLGRFRCQHLEIASNLEESEQLLKETQSVYCLEAELGKRLEFGGVNSQTIQTALKRTESGGKLSPEMLRALLGLLKCMQQTQSLIKSIDRSQTGAARERVQVLIELVEDLAYHNALQKDISKAIDEECNVKDNASPSLSKIRSQVRVLERKVIAQVRQKGENTAVHNGRVCLVIYSSELNRYEKNFLLLGNAENGMVYVEPTSVIAMNNALTDLRAQEKAEIEMICWKLTNLVYDEIESIGMTFEVFIKLDIISARARYTSSINGMWPQLLCPDEQVQSERFSVRLKQLRNPLLLWEVQKTKLFKQKDKKLTANEQIVPIDIFIEKRTSAVIITGPNTGGKTACMKSFGIVSLMSRAGLGIPASGSVLLPLFDNVYADIGDDQSLSNNLSTFSSHISHIQDILDHATRDSLVLLDELGTGTDPVEGASLGTAIVRAFIRDRARILIATTHFSHISNLKFSNPDVENAAVDFDPVTLKPTYQVLWGVTGKSNAFHISKTLGLQEEILSSAMEMSDALPMDKGKEMGATLQELRENIDDSSLQIKRNIAAARASYEKCQDLVEDLRVHHAKLNQQKKVPVENLLQESRLKMRNIMKMKVKSKAEAKDTPQKSSKMSKLMLKAESKARKKSLTRKGITKSATTQNIQTGSIVFIPKFKAKATVLSILKDELLVQMGAVKIKVKRNSVQLC